MNNKEFQLQHDLGLAKWRIGQYTKTIAEQTAEISTLREAATIAYGLLWKMTVGEDTLDKRMKTQATEARCALESVLTDKEKESGVARISEGWEGEVPPVFEVPNKDRADDYIPETPND